MLSIVFVCMLMLAIVDVRIGALPQTSTEPRDCRQCSNTDCNQPVKCPDDQPYCTTVTSAPNFTSTLSCGAAQTSPCVLEYKAVYLLTCICDDHLCNAPYNRQLLSDLLSFSTEPPSVHANLTEKFLKFSAFANVSNEAIYEMVTTNTTPTTAVTSTSASKLDENSTHAELPRAEALKHATVPPDDDEDEGEGSGTDESKVREPAPPAAPSSFLPAKENDGPRLALDIIFFATLFLHH